MLQELWQKESWLLTPLLCMGTFTSKSLLLMERRGFGLSPGVTCWLMVRQLDRVWVSKPSYPTCTGVSAGTVKAWMDEALSDVV